MRHRGKGFRGEQAEQWSMVKLVEKAGLKPVSTGGKG